MDKIDKILKICIDNGLIQTVLLNKKNNTDWALTKSTFITKLDKLIRLFAISLVRKREKVVSDRLFIVTTKFAYYCNPKYICESLIRKYSNVEIYWSSPNHLPDGYKGFPEKITVVNGHTYEFFKLISSSKMILDNSIESLAMGYKKKHKQLLVEIWHGSYGFKRFDNISDIRWLKTAKKFGKMTDICLSNSVYETEIFRSTFWKNSKIIMIGQPSNDILINDGGAQYNNNGDYLKKRLSIPKETKIALYAPTYRFMSQYVPILDYQALKDALINRFGGEWTILFRIHYESEKNGFLVNLPDFVIDVSSLDDIYELLPIVDVGITDYSSWMCSFILTKKPGFLFTPDLDEYVENRGFFHSLDESPLSISKTTSDLEQAINDYNNDSFLIKCNAYLEKIGYVNNNHASDDSASLLLSLMEDK